MVRKLLAGVLGGLAFFTWAAIAHLATGLAETGIQEIPNEQAVVGAITANVKTGGFYFIPGTGLANATHSERMAAMQKKAKEGYVGPSAIIIYRTPHSFGFDPKQFLTELGTNIVQVLLAVFLLGQTTLTSFAARWRFVTVAGILAAISTNVSYWNFYEFPTSYTIAYICIIAMGFVCAGLVVAAMIKPGAGMPTARGAAA